MGIRKRRILYGIFITRHFRGKPRALKLVIAWLLLIPADGIPCRWVPFNEASRRGRFVMFYNADTFLITFQGTDTLTWLSGDIGNEKYIFQRV